MKPINPKPAGTLNAARLFNWHIGKPPWLVVAVIEVVALKVDWF
jgi:hypothetical protein